MFLTYTGTVLYAVETSEFTVQFNCGHLELVGIPFGEIRRKRALLERRDSCFLFLFEKKKKKRKKQKYST